MPTTTTERPNPLRMTRDDRERWLRENGRTIGGTAAGAILGLNPNRDAAQVWQDLMFGRSNARNARMDRGNAMEPIIATIYSEETGRHVYGDGATITPHRDPALWFLHSTQDRLIDMIMPARVGVEPLPRRHGTSRRGVLEIKCLGTRTFQETKQEGLAPMYYAQFQHYLDVHGLDWGAFAIFNAEEWELYHFDLGLDVAFTRAMRAELIRFWHDHVLTAERPGPARTPVVEPPAHVGSEAVVIEGSVRITNALRALQRAAEEKKLAEQNHELAGNAVKEIMEELGHERIRVPNVGTVSWTPYRTTSIDRERLAQEHPEIDLASFTNVTDTRRFSFRPERTRR